MYRHGAIRTITNEAKYTGVTSKLILPTTINTPDGYVDWYFGMGDALIESGISYSSQGFKVFLGVTKPNGDSVYNESKVVSSLQKGQTVDLKLVYDHSKKQVTLYVNGSALPHTNMIYVGDAGDYLGTYNKVKMLHGVGDQGNCSYSQASFSQTQLRMDTAGAVYKPWTSDLSTTVRVVPPAEKGQPTPSPDSAKNFTIYNFAPLITKLDPLS